MKSCFLSLSLLAYSCSPFAFAATPPPCDAQSAARAAVAVAGVQRPAQAPVTPQAPTVQPYHAPDCACEKCGAYCVMIDGKCACQLMEKARPPVLKHRAAAHPSSLLIISETGCQPCMRLAAALEKDGQAADFPDWKYRVDHPELVARYNVTAFPTIILLRDGREVARRVGYTSPAELRRWCDDPSGPISEGDGGRSAPVLFRSVYGESAYPAVAPAGGSRPVMYAPAFCAPGRS